jgi:lipopolysaccharide transport system ATP-binding protein
MTEPAIKAEGLGKCYQVSHSTRNIRGVKRLPKRNTLRDTLVRLATAPVRRWRNRGLSGRVEPFWALQDVSFEVQPGEVIGIIGRNGAGKSTLLKILSRITKPTAGRAVFRGRVGSLLEVGTGFHPELTGRENIYLNGGLLGMSRREIAHNFANIVEFAEVEQFLDTPVKRYSSGMYVRLAFAVAAHLRPEILVVDEVLAVGDAAFQKKCLGKMGEVSRSGRTVIVVSHNMATILNLCRRVIVLEKGRLSFVGPCNKGVEHYMQIYNAAPGAEIDLTSHPNRKTSGKPVLQKIRQLNSRGKLTDEFQCGESMTIEFLIDPAIHVPNFDIEVQVEDAFGVPLFVVGPNFSPSAPLAVDGGQRLICHLDQLPLAPGRYSLTVDVSPHRGESVDHIDQAARFQVVESDFFGTGQLPEPTQGRFLVPSRWSVADS